MKKIFVKCNAIDCLHYSRKSKSCCIGDDTFIDISTNGSCIDYTPMSQDEINEIVKAAKTGIKK